MDASCDLGEFSITIVPVRKDAVSCCNSPPETIYPLPYPPHHSSALERQAKVFSIYSNKAGIRKETEMDFPKLN